MRSSSLPVSYSRNVGTNSSGNARSAICSVNPVSSAAGKCWTGTYIARDRSTRSGRSYKRAPRPFEDYVYPDSRLQSKQVLGPRCVSSFPSHCPSRFDIEDRKGLELVILLALLTFNDSNDVHHTPEASSSSIPRRGSGNNMPTSPISGPTPTPPPKPPKKLGIDRIAEIQAIRGQFNEVTVEDEGSIDDYAQYCANLFQVCTDHAASRFAKFIHCRMICYS